MAVLVLGVPAAAEVEDAPAPVDGAVAVGAVVPVGGVVPVVAVEDVAGDVGAGDAVGAGGAAGGIGFNPLRAIAAWSAEGSPPLVGVGVVGGGGGLMGEGGVVGGVVGAGGGGVPGVQIPATHGIPTPKKLPPCAAQSPAVVTIQFPVGRQHAPTGGRLLLWVNG